MNLTKMNGSKIPAQSSISLAVDEFLDREETEEYTGTVSLAVGIDGEGEKVYAVGKENEFTNMYDAENADTWDLTRDLRRAVRRGAFKAEWLEVSRDFLASLEKYGFADIGDGAYLAAREYMESEQEGWDDEDEAKHVDFSAHPYWVKEAGGPELEGYDSIEDALMEWAQGGDDDRF